VQRVDLPVERITRIKHGVRQDCFIALDTDLREILEAPFTSRIANLEQDKAQLYREGQSWHDKCYELTRRITSFNNLPWYRRIFAKV